MSLWENRLSTIPPSEYFLSNFDLRLEIYRRPEVLRELGDIESP